MARPSLSGDTKKWAYYKMGKIEKIENTEYRKQKTEGGRRRTQGTQRKNCFFTTRKRRIRRILDAD